MRIELDPGELRERAAGLRRAAVDLARTVSEMDAALALIGQSSPTLRALGVVTDDMKSRANDLEERADFAETYQPIEDIGGGDGCVVDAADGLHPVEQIAQGLINYGAGRANGVATFASEAFNMTPVPFALQQLGIVEPVDIEVPAAYPDADHADVVHGIGTAEGYLGLTAIETVLGKPTGAIGIGSAVLQTVAAIDELARRLLPIDGFHDVIIHGSPHAMLVDQVDGQVAIDHRTLAKLITISPEYEGGPIRIVASASGTSMAQDLANKLGVEVLAPEITWLPLDGASAGGKTAPASVEFLVFSPMGL